jgi:hypothetical protein
MSIRSSTSYSVHSRRQWWPYSTALEGSSISSAFYHTYQEPIANGPAKSSKSADSFCWQIKNDRSKRNDIHEARECLFRLRTHRVLGLCSPTVLYLRTDVHETIQLRLNIPIFLHRLCPTTDTRETALHRTLVHYLVLLSRAILHLSANQVHPALHTPISLPRHPLTVANSL